MGGGIYLLEYNLQIIGLVQDLSRLIKEYSDGYCTVRYLTLISEFVRVSRKWRKMKDISKWKYLNVEPDSIYKKRIYWSMQHCRSEYLWLCDPWPIWHKLDANVRLYALSPGQFGPYITTIIKGLPRKKLWVLAGHWAAGVDVRRLELPYCHFCESFRNELRN